MTDLTSYYITKYALTDGIWIGAGSISPRVPRLVSVGGRSYFLGTEAFLTREEALADAEKRRTRKIASLEKQLAKLRDLSFTEETIR